MCSAAWQRQREAIAAALFGEGMDDDYGITPMGWRGHLQGLVGGAGRGSVRLYGGFVRACSGCTYGYFVRVRR